MSELGNTLAKVSNSLASAYMHAIALNGTGDDSEWGLVDYHICRGAGTLWKWFNKVIQEDLRPPEPEEAVSLFDNLWNLHKRVMYKDIEVDDLITHIHHLWRSTYDLFLKYGSGKEHTKC